MTSFYVGQVVVCIDDRGFPEPDEGERYPKEGGVYTIRAVRPWKDTVGLLLAEIVNPVFEWESGNVGKIGFLARRFRPAKTTSLEVFEDMLALDLETA
jgi:hypothetical protein